MQHSWSVFVDLQTNQQLCCESVENGREQKENSDLADTFRLSGNI